MTKNLPDSKCAADCNLILATCETEYLPPLGIFRICSRIKPFRPAAVALCATSSIPMNVAIIFDGWTVEAGVPACKSRAAAETSPVRLGPATTALELGADSQ